MSEEDKGKIDLINKTIDEIYKEQKKLDSSITSFNKEIKNIDNNILKIKSQKTIIREIYHEEIIRVDNYNDAQLDSFFTNRYGNK